MSAPMPFCGDHPEGSTTPCAACCTARWRRNEHIARDKYEAAFTEESARMPRVVRPLLRDEGDVSACAEEQVDEPAAVELEAKPDTVLAFESVREPVVEALSEVPDMHVRIEIKDGSVVVELHSHGAEGIDCCACCATQPDAFVQRTEAVS